MINKIIYLKEYKMEKIREVINKIEKQRKHLRLIKNEQGGKNESI